VLKGKDPEMKILTAKSAKKKTQSSQSFFVHFAQTLTYMKPGNYKLGLLIDFNVVLLKDGIKR
jgi:hypothetical protein